MPETTDLKYEFAAGLETGWVKPPRETTGLDHLGVQMPGIEIYGQLLPGITNVTDRIRYVSFYAWLFWQFEQREWRALSQWRPMLRRAECLFSLIALRHGQVVEGIYNDHGGTTVGSGSLYGRVAEAAQGQVLDLDDYAHEASENERPGRYFKNRLGGFGQYYFGQLRQLGVLSGEGAASARLVDPTGVMLARALDAGVDGAGFFRVLENGRLTVADLDALVGFCPCALADNTAEKETLFGLLMRGNVEGRPTSDMAANKEDEQNISARAATLAWVQQLAGVMAERDMVLDERHFRTLAYTLADPEGQSLHMKGMVQTAARKWQVYGRHELFSVALQGLFQALLLAVDRESARRPFTNSEQVSGWFWREGPGQQVISGTEAGLAEWLQREGGTLPRLAEWTHPEHELAALIEIKALSKAGTVDVLKLTRNALRILAALLTRPENREGYGDIEFRVGYFNYYPINLRRFLDDMQTEPGSVPVEQGLIWLLRHYCLEAHYRVALRKLAQQGENTFQYQLSERGFQVRSVPQVAETTPRFAQAARVLLELGALRRDDELLRPTSLSLTDWLS